MFIISITVGIHFENSSDLGRGPGLELKSDKLSKCIPAVAEIYAFSFFETAEQVLHVMGSGPPTVGEMANDRALNHDLEPRFIRETKNKRMHPLRAP